MISSIFIISTLAGFAVATEGPQQVKIEDAVVGGHLAKRGQFPYQVSLQTANGDHFCGGSIINLHTILTAAHCCQGYSPNMIWVEAGTEDVKTGEGWRMGVREIRIHPEFNIRPHENDICILKLKQPIISVPSNRVAPVSLPRKRMEEPSGNAIVSGWGSTTPCYLSFFSFYLPSCKTQPTSNTLRWVEVPIVPDEECRRNYTKSPIGHIYNSMICAGETGKDGCFGDSGGPLVQAGTNVLIGVVSFGEGCGQSGFPGVYTQVSYFLDWINENSQYRRPWRRYFKKSLFPKLATSIEDSGI